MERVDRDALNQLRRDVASGHASRSELAKMEQRMEESKLEAKRKSDSEARRLESIRPTAVIVNEPFFVVESSRIGEWVKDKTVKGRDAKEERKTVKQSSTAEAYLQDDDEHDTEKLDQYALKEKVTRMQPLDDTQESGTETAAPPLKIVKKRKIQMNTRQRDDSD